MNHTPGPWQAVLQNADSGEKFDIWSGTYGSVTHLYETARTDEGLRYLHGDARLIAAAPDLLQALKEATAQMADTARRIEGRHLLLTRELMSTVRKLLEMIQYVEDGSGQ